MIFLDLRGETLDRVLRNHSTWEDYRNLRDLQDTIIYDDHTGVCSKGKIINNKVI